MRAARSKRNIGSAQLALLLAAGCSLQNFDYLQQGSGGSSAAGTSSSAGSSTTAGTDSGEGGEAAGAATGGNGGTAPSGGTKSGGSDSGGSASGDGGKGGSGGKGGAGGSGATGELVNGSFESGTVAGWTVDPAEALLTPPRYAFVQPPTSGATVPDGTYEFSTWHDKDSFNVDLYQTIKGLDDGTYVFKGYFNLDSGLVVNVYAINCGGEDPEPVPVLAGGAAAWVPVVLKGIEVKGGSCTVGVTIDSSPPHWLNADLFSFELDPDATPGGAGGAGGDSGQGGAN